MYFLNCFHVSLQGGFAADVHSTFFVALHGGIDLWRGGCTYLILLFVILILVQCNNNDFRMGVLFIVLRCSQQLIPCPLS